ncbi:nucleotidyltransferase family protein [Ramlibacter rhizophilus]
MPDLPVVLVLASGRGTRFLASGGEGSKLQALLAGRPVLEWTVDAVRRSGLPMHVEQGAHAGMGDSIAAAVRTHATAPGWLILPGDLPLVAPQTLRLIAGQLASHALVAPVFQGRRGHPVGFSRLFGERLMALQGPQGAGALLAGVAPLHRVAVEDAGVVTDIDTVSDLQEAERAMRSKLRDPIE